MVVREYVHISKVECVVLTDIARTRSPIVLAKILENTSNCKILDATRGIRTLKFKTFLGGKKKTSEHFLQLQRTVLISIWIH